MARSKTLPSLPKHPFRAPPKDECTVLKRLEAARQLYNACLGEPQTAGVAASVERLRRKGECAGGVVIEFPTSLRLSQLCHGCGMVKKKSLSDRWHHCDCGVAALSEVLGRK